MVSENSGISPLKADSNPALDGGERAAIVIIGGGAVGCGCAYALARAGKTDVLVLEREEEVGQVTTGQGAGLCGQMRDSVERVRLAMHSVRVFRELQATEVKPEWNEVGSIRLAMTDRVAATFARLVAVANEAGLEASLIGPAEAKRLWPAMEFGSVKAILWCASDGHMTPRSVARSYKENARRLGVRFRTGSQVDALTVRGGRVAGVRTSGGEVECERVVNAAGANAWHIARLAGIELPIVPVRHEYYVTVAMDGLEPGLPCFRIPELTLYGRVRDRGLLLGGWESKSLHVDPRQFGIAGAPPPVETDWPVLLSFVAALDPLFPAARASAASWVGKGWPTFTPDGRFIIGESARLPGFVMAGGCNAHGISGSGGIGKLLVESMFDPSPSPYVRSLSPDRFTETRWDWEEARRSAARVYETYYTV